MAYPASEKHLGKLCTDCGAPIALGESISHSRRHDGAYQHAPCTGNGNGNGAALAPQNILDALQTLGAVMAPRAATVDADAVAEIIADRVPDMIDAAVAKAIGDRTTRVEITRPDGTVARIEGAHYLMPRLLRLMGAGIHVYLWGPAGSGKTTAALQAATALGNGGEIDTLDPSTPKSSVMGYRTPQGEPVETAFSRCWAGRVYIADEVDNAPAHVQTMFNSALANGHAPLAWGSVERGEGFGFVGTGNTPGRPTSAFPDRKPMSAAFADRLYFLYFPLDPAIECRAGGLPAPAAPRRVESTCTPAAWVTWVQTVRAWCATNAPTVMVTPRASLIGLQALALGETPDEVAHGLIFRGADAGLVSKILAACPLPS